MPQARRFKIRPAPFQVSRSFAAPLSILWRAWSEVESLRRWFAPDGVSISALDLDFRVGSAFSLHLRTPDGHEILSRGEYVEIIAPERLVFHSHDNKFFSETIVTFEADGKGTLLTLQQAYEVYAPGFLAVAAGAPDAWRTTLDKLEVEVDRVAA